MDDDGGSGRTSPVVVVTRRALPGRRRAFERWLEELRAAATAAPGFLDLDVTEPDDRDPDTWAVVYRFASGAELDAWLASPQRRAVLDAGADLVVGPAREQRIAVPVVEDPVSAVISVRVRPDAAEEYARIHAAAVRRLASVPGFVRAELLPPVAGEQDDTVSVLTFASRDHLEGWLGSAARSEVLAQLAPLVVGERTVNVVGGFAGWFSTPDATPVRRWKQALVVLAALYPTALVLGAVLRATAAGLPQPVITLLGNVLGVAILTWLVMPPLTRLLDGWLRR